MLSIYQLVLGLKFSPTANPHVWHEDVKQYDAYNATDDSFVGHFYLDLHPREGKYGHAAEFDLAKGMLILCTNLMLLGCRISGKKQTPVAAMVANFTKPLPEKPALLKHDEVPSVEPTIYRVGCDLLPRVRACDARANDDVQLLQIFWYKCRR